MGVSFVSACPSVHGGHADVATVMSRRGAGVGRLGRMSLGETLLKLIVEHQQSAQNREFGMGEPDGREPSVIAADFERELRNLLA